MSKKRIIAIVTIIVLLFAAGISVGVFLYGRGETAATEGGQTTTDGNQVADGNQSTDGTQTGEGNEQTGETENPTINPNEGNDGGDNNQTVNNNNVAGNAGNVGNQNITTDTNVDNVGETTITRVEEQEKLVSEAFWDWWKPMKVAVTPTNIGVQIPQITVKKAAITGVGEDQFIYAGQDITYVIAVTNNGETDVENIEVTDRIPQNTTFVSIEDAFILRNVEGELSSETVGTKTTVGTDTVAGVKWVVSIPGGETLIARFTVKVNDDVKGTISNTAIANGEKSNDGEPTKTAIIEANKSSEITRNDKIVEIAKIGDLITYTITIENTGDVEGTTYITDTVPEGTKFVSAQEGAIISEEEDSVIWSVTVPAGEIVTREFVVEVVELNEAITNIAYVGGTGTETDTVKVEAYIQFVENGGTEVEDITGVAGEKIENTIMPETERIGYDFDGWYKDDEFNEEINELPSEYTEGITIYYAKWVARTDTKYKVEHYLQDLDLDGYTLDAEETKTGTTGAQTQAETKDYKGFTAQSFEQKEITGDGSTVVEIYYTRNTDTQYKVEHYLQNLDLDGYTLDAEETKTGITGAQTQAEVKDYAGFTPQSFEQKEIAGDSSTVVEIYYTRNTDTQYKVQHYLQDLDLDGYMLDATEDKTGITGEQTQAEAKDYKGFTAQSFEQKEIAGDGSTVVEIYYTRNTDTQYKVQHYLQNLDLNGYTLDATEDKKGITGAQTQAEAKDYKGFTVQKFEQKEIAGDGSTVVEIYYTRNTDTQYKVQHYLQNLDLDGYTLDAEETKTGITGAQTQAEAKDYKGFIVQSFEQKEILGNGTTVVEIYYTRNVNTSYKVQHYLQDLGLDGYTLDAEETKTGTTGAQTQAEVKDYKGFTAQSFEQKEIAGDGSTVVEIYYTRNTNTGYKVEHYLQNLDLNKYILDVTENKTGKTGAQTQAEAKDYKGFTVQKFEQKEIAGDGSTVVEIYYTRNTDTQYKVQHYLQNLDLNGYTLDAEETKTGITGGQTQAEVKDYKGFTAQSFEQKEILGNGTTVVEIYYTRNTDTQYKVQHYLQNLDLNGYTLDAEETKTGTTGEQTQAEAKDYKGFTAQRFEQKEILGNGTTVVEIYYTRNTDTQYKVQHYLQNLNLNGYTLDAEETKTGTTGAQTQAEAKDYKGFTAQSFEQKEILGNGTTVVEIYYTRNTDTQYKVQHYLQNLDLNGYTLDAEETKTGTTGAQTQAEAKDYKGFTAQRFEQKEIAGDGSTVVEIYYTRNTNTQYKVHHYLQNLDLNGYTLDAEETKTGTTGAQTQAEAKDYKGFTAQRFEQKEIAGDGSTVVEIYYTRNTDTQYKVEHYLQDLDLDGYTLDAEEIKTGITGEQTQAEAKDYKGFTAQRFEQKEITGDGSTVVEIYYTRKTNIPYTIKYYFNMSEDINKRENGTAIYEQEIKDEVDDYSTNGWVLNENISTKLPYTIQDSQTANVIKMYYEKADITVKKESIVSNRDGSVVINDERNNRITYRITAKNNGYLQGTVTIADSAPTGTEIVSDIILTSQSGEKTEIDKDVFATTGVNVTLQHNEEVKIEFTVKVINILPGSYVENTPIINGKTDNTNKVQNIVEKTINVKSKAETIKGTNIVIVLDLSASMNDIIDGVSKLEAAKDAAQSFISKIFENGANGTQVSVVTFNFSEADKNNYSTETDSKYVGTKVFTYKLNNETKTVVTNKAEADAINAEIEKIQLESNLGTNMGAGLIKAEQQIGVLNQLNSSNEDVIIFLGDGDPEGGGTENQKTNIINKATAIKKAGTKIYTIGFGLHQELDQFCCYTTWLGILVPFDCTLENPIPKDKHTTLSTIFGNIHHHKTTVYEEEAISILRSMASGNTDAEKQKYARSSDDAESLISTFESISKDIAYTDKPITSERGLVELIDIYTNGSHVINITVNGVAQTPITSLPTQENDRSGIIVLIKEGGKSKYYLNLAKFEAGANVSVEFFAE